MDAVVLVAAAVVMFEAVCNLFRICRRTVGVSNTLYVSHCCMYVSNFVLGNCNAYGKTNDSPNAIRNSDVIFHLSVVL